VFPIPDHRPASSSPRVYYESLARYAILTREVEELTAAADAGLCRQIARSDSARPVGVINSLCWDRAEWLKLNGRWIKAKVPSLGYAVVDAATGSPFDMPIVSESLLENDTLRIAFDKSGAIVSCFDKEAGREALAPGTLGNVLVVYQDDGDGWDVPMDYREPAPNRPPEHPTEGVRAMPRAC